MNLFQDEKIATVVDATKNMAQVSCLWVFKHHTKEKSRLQPYGLAIVTAKQITVPSGGSHTFT